jgi:dTMP kinase
MESPRGKAVFSGPVFFLESRVSGEAGDRDLPLKLNGDFPLPEYLFFFDIDPDIAMDRVEKRAGTLEIYEKREFQKRSASGILISSPDTTTEPDMTVVRIDATLGIEEIADRIWGIARNLPKIEA